MADTVELSGSGDSATIVSRRSVPVGLALQPAIISGGLATGGQITAHHLNLPWAYTLNDVPTEVAIGTALHVPIDVVVNNMQAPFNSPQFQTAHFGPRAIINIEGRARYQVSQNAFGFSPVGFGDFLAVANEPSGVAKTIVPSWHFLSGRSYLARGADVPLGNTDVGNNGEFVSSTVLSSMNSGHLNGFTNNVNWIHYEALLGIGGHVSLRKRIGFNIKPVFAGNPAQSSDHWDFPGEPTDALSFALDEEIGFRCERFNHGTLKVGLRSQHRIQLYSDANNFDGTGLVMIQAPAVNLTANVAGWTATAFDFRPTIVASEDSNAFTSGTLFNNQAVYKTANAQAQSMAILFGVNQSPTFQGDGAALTHTGFTAYLDGPTVNRINAGSVTLTDLTGFSSGPLIDTGTTVTTRKAVNVSDPTGGGTLTNQFGIDIAALSKASTLNVGIRNASPYVATPTTQTLSAAGNAITANAEYKTLDNNTGASLTLTSAPTIADGQNGQEIELTNVDSADNIVLQDQGTLANSNLRLQAATITLTPRDSVRLRYSTAVGDWVQTGPVSAVL